MAREVASRPLRGAEILIQPTAGWGPVDVREVWEHRELLYLLVWRTIKVRYQQTAFGAAWALIPPVPTMLVFTLIFGRLAHVHSDGAPYALFTYCALVPWVYFSNAVILTSTSLVENERLLTRVYFPRVLVPLAAALAGIVDFVISFVLLVVLAVAYGAYPTPRLLAVVPLALLAVAAAFAIGMGLAALNVFYRDVRYVIPFMMQFWLFVTPVAYATSLLPSEWRYVYALNPMTGVIDGFGGPSRRTPRARPGPCSCRWPARSPCSSSGSRTSGASKTPSRTWSE